MRLPLLPALAATLGVVAASPLNEYNGCPQVSAVLRLAHANSAASKFCSRYLHVPSATTKTVTSTSTPTITNAVTGTVTALPSTVLVTVTTEDVGKEELTINFYQLTLIMQTTVISVSVTLPPKTVTVTEAVTATNTISCFNEATTLGPPTPIAQAPGFDKRYEATPSCFKGWSNKGLTSACKCLHLTRPTSTVTATKTGAAITTTITQTTTSTPITTVTDKTVTVPVLTTTSITVTLPAVTVTEQAQLAVSTPALSGMNYYVYYVTYDYAAGGNGIEPEDLKNPNYYNYGVIDNLDTINSATGSVQLPNGNTAQANGLGIVFQGFFFAATAGQYTFSTPDRIDNELMLWHGPVAYTEWTKSNLDYDALRAGTTATGGIKVLSLAAGEIVPVTIVFGNSGPVSNLLFYIETPDGTVHTSTSGFFTPQCDVGGPFSP